MTPMEIGAVVGSALVGGGAVIIIIIRVLKNGKNGNGADTSRLLLDGLKEQTAILREIRDSLMTLRSDQRMSALEQAHLQKSVDALHSRFDRAAGVPQ